MNAKGGPKAAKISQAAVSTTTDDRRRRAKHDERDAKYNWVERSRSSLICYWECEYEELNNRFGLQRMEIQVVFFVAHACVWRKNLQQRGYTAQYYPERCIAFRFCSVNK